MSPTQWLPTILTVVFFFWSLALPSHGSSQFGYGYVVRSVAVDSNQKVSTANLDLIKPSSVYAPDVQTLTLHVSLETSERLRIRVTDSTQQRWKIPETVIPRTLNHSPRRFLTEANGGNSTENNTLEDPSSDLIFTLHNDAIRFLRLQTLLRRHPLRRVAGSIGSEHLPRLQRPVPPAILRLTGIPIESVRFRRAHEAIAQADPRRDDDSVERRHRERE
ncbi:hypothetical protein Bca52824_005462 [Brassica carinata]|uniref:Uncharacterized protein n=1 Tax=Brassica carinata TaxID=52824 RepID=A0A8X8BGA3_BRACI|nr:hypothetical protein Bca52824_005462 [Brassica carinata]